MISLCMKFGHQLLNKKRKLYITKTRQCNILQFFAAVKKVNFQMKNCNVFLIFAQNIDCGYTLEPQTASMRRF